ncbi:pyridoxal-phosphate-dependent aminotransferase family protein [Pontivivens insulae]|uniref:Soluble hydrogenase 42 kDa subunit n=1 Tax=Pontivivens insulae TaxID=1639689 RepID=A0A2R8AA69_9RHOB|nr:aminotransferase class V-fold PLP-dependent enzyme [Pontivivens insulae]RED13017.1 alanine-glyoxylate transaminase/serine-glyoxylate transaminase/serine-pyruvate transaminase [Pontivivens insulae]SPF29109.1 Soluble hydrogenase 42 kDa subunit [Pontivivens insulae]
MTQKFGPATLAIPGPSTAPERVLRAMHRASPNIYEGELVDMMPGIVADLKAVARTAHDVSIYICNGHGTWEAALSNTLSRGDQVLVLATGRFAQGWKEMGESLHLKARMIDFGTDAAVELEQVAAALAADTDHQIKAVLCCHTDTASSVRNDIAGLGQLLSDTGHPALFMVDCIASLACEPFEMDRWGVDVMITGCQKGLMTPAGMGFVFHGPRAWAAHETADLRSGYWDWESRARPKMFYQRFCGTAPTHHLYGLREALNMLVHEEGIEQVWARHERNARAVWAAVDHWAEQGVVQPNVADRANRSTAVTTLRLTEGSVVPLRRWAEEEAGVTLGVGLGLDINVPRGDNLFRIGHMGHLNAHSLLGTLAATEAAMLATNTPFHPGGVAEAIKVYAAV